jgi:hypothetical protein
MSNEILDSETKSLISENQENLNHPSRPSSFLGNLKVAFRYVLAETAKDKKNFIVGICTVFIVVFSIR